MKWRVDFSLRNLRKWLVIGLVDKKYYTFSVKYKEVVA